MIKPDELLEAGEQASPARQPSIGRGGPTVMQAAAAGDSPQISTLSVSRPRATAAGESSCFS